MFWTNIFTYTALPHIRGQFDYRAHTNVLFFQLKTLKLYDLVELNTLIILFKARTNALPIKLMSFVNLNSNNIHSTRQEGNFKEMHCRTKIKYMCISVNGPKVWTQV